MMQKRAILSKYCITGYQGMMKSGQIFGSILYRISLSLFTLLAISHNAAANSSIKCKTFEGNVPRAMFTTDIDNREPVDRVLILDDSADLVYFFSDLRRLQGMKIKHRWEFEGKIIKEKSFDVNGPRWRVYSSHNLDKEMTGRWTVVIADENDCPLRAVIFRYVPKQESGQTAAIIKLR